MLTLATLPKAAPDSFYEHSSSASLQAHILAVVDTEGPVLDTVLFKRIARAWGLERRGPRIVERLRSLTPSSIFKTVDGDKTFYWPNASQPAQRPRFRVANGDEQSRRHISEVCLEEVGALMRHLLEHAGGSSKQELARISCRMLGMSRMAGDAEARALAALDLLVSSGIAKADGEVVRLVA